MRPVLPRLALDEVFGRFQVSLATGNYCSFRKFPSNRLHSHNYFEICLVLSGSGDYLHGDKRFPLRRGDLFLCDPSVEHEISSWKTRDLELVFFTCKIQKLPVPVSKKEISKNYEESLFEAFGEGHHVLVRGQESLEAWLPLLIEKTSEKLPGNWSSRQILKTLVLECVSRLTQNKSRLGEEEKEPESQTAVDKAMDFIAKNVRRPMTVREVAGRIPTTERNLLHLFRKHLNKGVLDVIHEHKLQYAAHQLLMRFKASEIASQIGLEHPSQFSRLFKNHFGISPKAYQMKHAPTGPSFRTERKKGVLARPG